MGDSGEGITLSDDIIRPSASNGEQTFRFRDVAGAQVSFKDFNQFRLFDEDLKVLVATANVPANLTATTNTNTAKTPVSGGFRNTLINLGSMVILFGMI